AVTALVPGFGEYRPGEERPILHVAGIDAAIVICWEAIFPSYVARSSAHASLILDLTNDAWLGAAAPAEQHLAMAAMRAVETRRPLVRAANSGISAFIGPDGAIHRRTPFGARLAIVGEVHPRTEMTAYARYGDVFAIAATLAALALLVYAGLSGPRGAEPGVLTIQ
ncbi:MAG: nitrilase-related carbon-nitrogen hydrolase, partial [Candidatus Binatia bacterium]